MFVSWPLIAGGVALAAVVVLVFRVLRKPEGDEEMVRISRSIRAGAGAFLRREYITVGIILVFLALGMSFTSLGWRTAVSFVLGAVVSGAAGLVGMLIATRANARTTEAAKSGTKPALSVAVSGGAVMGLSVVGLSLLGLTGVLLLFAPELFVSGEVSNDLLVREAGIINGFAMGASLMALFARAGGGIFTKGADMAADLVGKVEANIPEDDPRNPAVIADNVGDNVGDVAGLGADLLESYVESIIASMALAAGLAFSTTDRSLMLLPLLIASAGVIASILGIGFTKFFGRKNPRLALSGGTYVSAVLVIAATFFIVRSVIPAEGFVGEGGRSFTQLGPFWASLAGILSGVLIALTSEYYTSSDFRPVKKLAEASQTNAAVTVTEGLAVGMVSIVLPILILASTVIFSNHICGMLGVALAAVGMLSTSGMVITVDSYGPIADNAGGIAQMSNQDPKVRRITDHLDAVGNTTAAIGKGFAIGSAALAALGLLTAYIAAVGGIDDISLSDPKLLAGFLVGGMLPFFFSSTLFRAVVYSANRIIFEVRRQFRELPGLREGLEGVVPDSESCVDISTRAALWGMLVPGLMALIAPVLIGFLVGPLALAGLLIGSIVTGLMLGVFTANSGGAMDNAKKYIEEGHFGGKGSIAHKASIVGDTVGDPLKDTVGPSINILIKLMAVISLVIAPLLTS